MKKIISLILTIPLITCGLVMPSAAEEMYPIKRKDLFVRDPFVLVYDGKYYMYGTGLSNGAGYGCVVSEDLENWSERIQIFSPSADFDGYKDFWAPECHYYKGSFYLFATYRSKASDKRGTAIFKSDSPTGPFEIISDGHITPKERDCIDGTLYVDEEGQPWMVYVNEWTSEPDEIGRMAVAKLSDDLTHFISEPKVLFKANGHFWTNDYITDGPFLYRNSKGELLMLWSNNAHRGGYAVGLAISDNGKVDGNWLHHSQALYKKDLKNEYDGGHAMLFETLDGQLMMSLHSPNGSDEVITHAEFIPVEENGDVLQIVEKEFLGCIWDMFRAIFSKIHFFFADIFHKFFIA